ncbi:MAG: DMT family transporter [Actinobacteria bacterium]|nr:DMT family transporter [Actinomycetota bacterium]
MVTVALALGSGLLWGCADFSGGFLSRRAPALAVAMLSQGAGFLALLLALAFVGQVHGASFRFGLLAGIGGAIGLALFYWALSIGTMSIVAPIAACSALLPFSLALARGERPSALALAGAALALLGVVAASLEERRAVAADRGRAVLGAVGSAVALGVFSYFLGRGGEAGSAFSTILGARVVSFGMLALAVLVLRTPLRARPWTLAAIAGVGLVDTAANALFALAADRGLLSIVAVLGSVYPIVTVLLAHALLGERITWTQRAGVLVAFAGIAAVSAG